MSFSFAPGQVPDPRAPWIQEAISNQQQAAASVDDDRPVMRNERRRARNRGRFRADDPTTSIDEAWEGDAAPATVPAPVVATEAELPDGAADERES